MKLLQHIFYTLFLTTTVGLLLAITTTCHLPAMTLWGILAITATIACTAMTSENTTNQKENQK